MVSSDTEGTLQLREDARRIPHTRTERSHSAVDAGMRGLYRFLRHVPRPVRPLLRPLWLAIDRRAIPDAERPTGSFPAIRLDRSIRPMTRAEFDELAARNAYYRGRQGYLGAAAWVASDLIEHLGSSQRAAFAEVRRVARHAIISLPIEWEMDDARNPHHGITHERVLSWFAPTEPRRVIVGNPGYRQRLMRSQELLIVRGEDGGHLPHFCPSPRVHEVVL